MGTVQWHHEPNEDINYLEDAELAEWLESQPQLFVGHTSSRYLDAVGKRVYVERVGQESGMPCNSAISVEVWNSGTANWDMGNKDDLIAALMSDGRPEAIAAAQRQIALR